MMDVVKFREVIRERSEMSDEWSFWIEQCWKKEIEILSQDIPSTIEYLKNECTADEYGWISEIIDDFAENTQSKEVIEVYKNLMIKYPDEYKKHNVSSSIKFAEDALDWFESKKTSFSFVVWWRMRRSVY